VKFIKIDTDGSSKFQYPHFLVDVLMLEIDKNVFNYDVVYRVKDLRNTIGNFSKIYEEVMEVQNVEISREEFDNMWVDELFTVSLRMEYKKDMIDKMKKYILKRYKISTDNSYPKVILIERDDEVRLINDKKLHHLSVKEGTNHNGKHKRELKNIEEVKNFLEVKKIDYECLVLEHIDFKKQVEYFYNANMIIGVHGGGLTNCIFSQENTVVIETEPKRDEYYSKLALCAGMKYYSCGEETENIINTIQREIDD
jgi:hypothetical protein